MDWRDPAAPHDLALQAFIAEQYETRRGLLESLFTAIDRHDWYEVVQLRGHMQHVDELLLSIASRGSDQRAAHEHQLLSTGR